MTSTHIVQVAPGTEFLADNGRLLAIFARDGVTAALEAFSAVLGAPSWLAERATADPDLVSRVEGDARTFFRADIPALMGWQFAPARAARVTCPVLYLGGADSHPWFSHVLDWVRGLFPDSESHLIAGAGHTVAATHSPEVASLLTAFLEGYARSPQHGRRPQG